MAMSAVMQSIPAGPVTRVMNGARLNLVPASYAPRLSRSSARLPVRSMAEDGQSQKEVTTPATAPNPTPQPSPPLAPKQLASGPAPERINGRLAMIGFVAAMAVEVSNGEDVFAQISNGGIPWFLGTSLQVLSLASLRLCYVWIEGMK